MKERRFRLDFKSKFLTQRVVRHWNKLPGDVMGAPSVEASRVR